MKAKDLSHDLNGRFANASARVFDFLQWFVYFYSRENPLKCIMFYIMGGANSVQTLRVQSRQSLPSASLPISFFPWPRDSFLAPLFLFHDRASKLAQKPRFSDFWRRKGLFCCLVDEQSSVDSRKPFCHFRFQLYMNV